MPKTGTHRALRAQVPLEPADKVPDTCRNTIKGEEHMWGYLILPVVLAVIAVVWFLVRRENKAISAKQADAMETRTKFGVHDGGNEGTAIRTITSMM